MNIKAMTKATFAKLRIISQALYVPLVVSYSFVSTERSSEARKLNSWSLISPKNRKTGQTSHPIPSIPHELFLSPVPLVPFERMAWSFGAAPVLSIVLLPLKGLGLHPLSPVDCDETVPFDGSVVITIFTV